MNKKTITVIVTAIILIATIFLGTFFFAQKEKKTIKNNDVNQDNYSQNIQQSIEQLAVTPQENQAGSKAEMKEIKGKNFTIVQKAIKTGLPDKEVVYNGKNADGSQMIWDLNSGSANGLPNSLGYESVSNPLPYQYVDYLALNKNNSLFFYNLHSLEINKANSIVWQSNQKVLAYPSVTEKNKYYVAIIDQTNKAVNAYIVDMSLKKISQIDPSGLSFDSCIGFDSSNIQLIKWNCQDQSNGAPVYAINLIDKIQKTVLDFSSASFNNRQPSFSTLVFPYFILVYQNTKGQDEITYMNLRNLADIRKITMPAEMAKTIKNSYASDNSLVNSFSGNIVGINQPYKTVVIVDKNDFMRFYRYDDQGNVIAVKIWEDWKFVTISKNKAYYTFQNGVGSYVDLETWNPNGF
jgi:hypothetical protein